MKSVVIYYSLEGNTEMIARKIAEMSGADVIKLLPEKEVPRDGFRKFFLGGMSVVFGKKPKLMNEKIDLPQYDTIYLGTPIWAGSFTPPVLSFLSSHQIKDKDVYLFVCNGGGETEKCFSKLREKLNGNRIKGEVSFVDPLKKDSADVNERLEEFLK